MFFSGTLWSHLVWIEEASQFIVNTEKYTGQASLSPAPEDASHGSIVPCAPRELSQPTATRQRGPLRWRSPVAGREAHKEDPSKVKLWCTPCHSCGSLLNVSTPQTGPGDAVYLWGILTISIVGSKLHPLNCLGQVSPSETKGNQTLQMPTLGGAHGNDHY